MEKAPKSKLRLIFADLIRGFSVKNDPKFGNIYLKHLSILESAEIDYLYEVYFQKAREAKCPTEEEQIVHLKKEELWTDKDDSDIRQLEEYLEGLRKTHTQVLAGLDKESIKNRIKTEEEKLLVVKNKKSGLIGSTAESFANKKINEFYIFNSLYKDPEFKLHLFSDEDFNDLSDEELGYLLGSYNEKFKLFNQNSLQRIALSNFFLNLFYISKENPHTFYGKPIVNLTFLQTELFSHGLYFKNLLSKMQDKPPDSLMDDPEAFIDHYNNVSNLEKVTSNTPKGDNSTTCVMGTKEDLDKMGVKNEEKNDVFAIMRKTGKKKMSMQEAMDVGIGVK